MLRIAAADIETNGLHDCDTIWLHGGIEYALEDGKLTRGELKHFEPWRGQKQKDEAIAWSRSIDLWVGHNFLGFDAITLNRLLSPSLIPLGRVVDTLIVSRLLKYDRVVPRGCKSGHSLEAHGARIGLPKGDFHDFENYSEEMVTYWKRDLEIQAKLLEEWWKYISDPEWKKAMRAEHDLQINLDQQTAHGFLFDKDKAESLLSSIEKEMTSLEAEIQEDWPPQLQEVHQIIYKINKDGSEGHHVQKSKQKYAMTKVDGENLICYDYVPFNPGSPKDRIEKLWEAGWKPFEKTKTHQEFSRTRPGQDWGKTNRMTQAFWQEKKDHFDYYGWTCSEDNLETLPQSAPPAARKLAQWLTLEGRRSSLVEWLGQVKEDGRIHGKVWHIGAWTGRCSHSDPNTANISAVWPSKKEAKTPVDVVKKTYDTAMRSCWKVPDDCWLVGVDAEGIQLRILADYLWRHFDAPDYAEAIVKGRKEDETDIHNLNKKALGLNHIDRDDAKTFIYAWVLGAGDPKIGSILKTDVNSAKSSKDRFEKSINGLYQLKNQLMPYIAEKGFFTGYDGRKVVVPNLHKTLAGILQNGEKVVMTHSRLRADKILKSDGINFNWVGFIHDENQTEVRGTMEEAEYVKTVQIQAIVDTGVELGFLCPLAGSGSIGKDWSQTH
jgi:DNA polymerase-1